MFLGFSTRLVKEVFVAASSCFWFSGFLAQPHSFLAVTSNCFRFPGAAPLVFRLMGSIFIPGGFHHILWDISQGMAA
ncbi:hypothetical protein EV426DRAFT_294897 [Tirmania nivea]|nr:hypothetical protein EV426DRAFT_294897 [Tirmania nivea]